MNAPAKISRRALQPFEPDPAAVYTLEAAAHLAHLSRRTILICCRHGLVSPVTDPQSGGYYFDDEGIRVLRRIEFLCEECGINLTGTKLILELMRQVERLQSELRRSEDVEGVF